MRRSARSSRADLGKRPSPRPVATARRGAAVGRCALALVLHHQSAAIVASCPWRSHAARGNARATRRSASSMPDGRVACDRGVSRSGGLHVTPVKQCINCIERRGGSAGIVFASGQHSRQRAELPDLRRRPWDAPARRKALTRESRHVTLQTDGQIAKLPCRFAPRSTVGRRNHDRTRPEVCIISWSPGVRHRHLTRVHPFHCRIAQCARVGTTTWRNVALPPSARTLNGQRLTEMGLSKLVMSDP